MRTIALLGFCLSLLGACARAQAESAFTDGLDLRLSGFGTIGALHSSAPEGWAFRREVTQPMHARSTEGRVDSRLGVQGNVAVDPTLEAVAQLVLKDRLRNTLAESLEWAFVAWRPASAWTVRLGRISPEIYMLADSRNIGFSYPWVRPSVDFYGSLPISWVDGADVKRTWDFGDVRWSLKGVAALHAGAFLQSAPSQEPARITSNRLVGFSLSRAQSGLTLHAQLARAKVEIGSTAASLQAQKAFAGLEALPIPTLAAEASRLSIGANPNPAYLNFASIGVEYQTGDWQTAVEASHISGQFPLLIGSFAYASLGRRLGDFTVFGMVGRAHGQSPVYSDPHWAQSLTPALGAQGAAKAQILGSSVASSLNRERADQRSIAIGARWDFDAQIALKAQWDHVQINANGSGLWATTSTAPATANVVSISLDFVF